MFETPTNGIVTPGMVPSNGGRPAALLTMITAAAPAAWPLMARSTRAQTPRWVMTMAPAGMPAYSSGSQPSPMPPPLPAPSTATGPVTPAEMSTPLATRPLTTGVESICAPG